MWVCECGGVGRIVCVVGKDAEDEDEDGVIADGDGVVMIT